MHSAAFSDELGGLAPQTWDSLVGNRMYSSRGWLRFCATDVGGSTVTGAAHVDVASGTMAVPVTAVREETNEFYQWQPLLRDRGLPSYGPSGLLVGTRRGYQTHLLAGPGVDAAAAVPELLAALRKLAGDLAGSDLVDVGAAGSVPCTAMFLGTPDVVALRAAGVETTPVLLTTDAWISVPTGDFSTWLAGLPSKGRRDSVKQEVKAFSAAKYELTRQPLTEAYQTAALLLTGTQKRYGHAFDLDLLAESLRRQAVAMRPAAQVLFCGRPGEEPVGMCVFYIHGDTLFVRAVGLDYERLAGAAEYFNLVYYEMVRIAAAEGLSWIHPGIESGDTKALRGARLSPLWLLDLAEDSVLLHHESAIRQGNAAWVDRLALASPAAGKAFDRDLSQPFW